MGTEEDHLIRVEHQRTRHGRRSLTGGRFAQLVGLCQRDDRRDLQLRQKIQHRPIIFARIAANVQQESGEQPASPLRARRATRQGPTSAIAAISWLRDLTVSVLIAVVVILFLYQPVRVEGTSMMPALVDQERIFINKFAYRFGISDIQRGDTVVFWFPGDPSKSFIKRVIGIPGDKVQVTDGLQNGQRVVTTGAFELAKLDEDVLAKTRVRIVTVPGFPS